MALATRSGQSGNRGGVNTLPPFRDAVNRARQIAGVAQSLEAIASDEDAQEEYVAVKRARDISRFQHKSAFGRLGAAVSMALEHRKAIKEGDLSVFIPAFVFAIAKDGFLDMIPGLGQIFGFPVAVYLFVFLWGHGVWKMRIKTRIIIGILSLLDFIPVIGMIPMSTMGVFYVYRQVSKRAFEAKMQLKDLEKSM